VRGTVAASLLVAVGLAALALVEAGLSGVARADSQPDRQCTERRASTAVPPAAPASATDYLALGDYEYERGECDRAVAAYTRALELNPVYAEAYNNRAYVRMRQQEYAAALPDLDRAIALRPTYVNALMNRGDIYNYYYAIDRGRAIADYDRVIAQGPEARRGTSVCGHRMLALNDGWGPTVVLDMLSGGVESGCRDEGPR
jgi:tetratricopeptide (TPR) repeat protein